jgi:cobalamin synthase
MKTVGLFAFRSIAISLAILLLALLESFLEGTLSLSYALIFLPFAFCVAMCLLYRGNKPKRTKKLAERNLRGKEIRPHTAV